MNQHDVYSRQDGIVLPLPPEITADALDIALYARFMQHLRQVPTSRMEIKILSAIQFTADMLGHSDAHVSKTLVELGLRVPRAGFPAEFLRFADMSLRRCEWAIGGPSESLLDLQSYWGEAGESKFAYVSGDYSLVNEGASCL